MKKKNENLLVTRENLKKNITQYKKKKRRKIMNMQRQLNIRQTKGKSFRTNC